MEDPRPSIENEVGEETQSSDARSKHAIALCRRWPPKHGGDEGAVEDVTETQSKDHQSP